MTGSTARGRIATPVLGFPHPPYLGILVRRSALIWMLMRLLLFLVLSTGGDISAALHPTFTTRVLLGAGTALLVWFDRRRARELLLHANLGTRPGWFWAASLLTAAVLDLTIQMLIEVL